MNKWNVVVSRCFSEKLLDRLIDWLGLLKKSRFFYIVLIGVFLVTDIYFSPGCCVALKKISWTRKNSVNGKESSMLRTRTSQFGSNQSINRPLIVMFILLLFSFQTSIFCMFDSNFQFFQVTKLFYISSITGYNQSINQSTGSLSLFYGTVFRLIFWRNWSIPFRWRLANDTKIILDSFSDNFLLEKLPKILPQQPDQLIRWTRLPRPLLPPIHLPIQHRIPHLHQPSSRIVKGKQSINHWRHWWVSIADAQRLRDLLQSSPHQRKLHQQRPFSVL